jgi:hypothetical protein
VVFQQTAGLQEFAGLHKTIKNSVDEQKLWQPRRGTMVSAIYSFNVCFRFLKTNYYEILVVIIKQVSCNTFSTSFLHELFHSYNCRFVSRVGQHGKTRNRKKNLRNHFCLFTQWFRLGLLIEFLNPQFRFQMISDC